MEVADQWRREWAGTAEYGKVVEGGVTRRIARAMEVLHASGPGARMRVMRAAYHTTAGPGVPASSYMMHASRRVYSSGFDFLEPPSLPTEPLEISSTPLALLQDTHADTANYEVTEPDDLEISEPSKWRSSTGGSMRMPSEESSSTDNASIIDVDSKIHKNVIRKYSCDSENSDILPSSGRSSRISPLLDAPALSSLKFKSLLNGNSDWNNRRKSYSFEDTSPLTETILHSNDTLAMESSTDSGICKSTELVNDHSDDNANLRYFGSNEKYNKPEDTFQSWLTKNKQNNYYKGTKFKSYRDHEVVIEDPKENNITLQSTGKVMITLPVTLETEQEYESRKNYEENQRRSKRVEFCKTELHFAAETGKVNIIATDEKPPPSNDFRKRRSAFVPMRDMPEKPITLFGEKTNDFSNESNSLGYIVNEYGADENTAATKSILKNKIPKPKPYLLGENMAFGVQNEPRAVDSEKMYVPTAVSLINKQLQSEKRDDDISASFSRQHTVSTKIAGLRTTNPGPIQKNTRNEAYGIERGKTQKIVRIHDEKNKFGSVKRTPAITRSPTPARLKTRELRESDLTYFGVDNVPKGVDKTRQKTCYLREVKEESDLHDLFQSVRLIQQVSNSVCNSESEDAPEYQNLPIHSNYVPKPSPRIRSKFDDKPNHIEEVAVLKPIVEQDVHDDNMTPRRCKSRKQEDMSPIKNRSRSEPRKSYQFNSIDKTKRQLEQAARSSRDHSTTGNGSRHQTPANKSPSKARSISDDNSAIYINLKTLVEQRPKEAMPKHVVSAGDNNTQEVPRSNESSLVKTHRKLDATKSNTSQDTDSYKNSLKRRQKSEVKNTNTLEKKNQSLKRNTEKQQSEKAEKSHVTRHKTHSKFTNEKAFETDTNRSSDSKNKLEETTTTTTSPDKKEHRSRSLQRHSKAAPDVIAVERITTSQSTKDSPAKHSGGDVEVHKRRSSKDKTNSRNESPKVMPKVIPNASLKPTNGKDPRRHGSRSRQREYVINYDDKNGTVSSICKISAGSGSPRRKKTTKEIVKEKFKETLKNKSDKAALLQPEDHQRYSNTVYEDKKRRKAHTHHRSCQVL